MTRQWVSCQQNICTHIHGNLRERERGKKEEKKKMNVLWKWG